MIFMVFLLAVTAAIYFLILKPAKYWEERGFVHIKGWPFIGNMGESVFRRISFTHLIQKMYNTFPNERYFGMYQFLTPTLVIRDPELIKTICVKEFDTFPDHQPTSSGDSEDLASKNIFSLKGDQHWRDMRATLSPAFTSSKMRLMFNLINDCAKQFNQHFLKQNETVTVEMKDTFARFTNDVIATTAFGITCDSLKERDNEFFLMGKAATDFNGLKGLKFFGYTISPFLMKLLKVSVFDQQAQKFFTRIVGENIKHREEKGIIRPDMIHLLLEARKGRLKHEEQEQVPDSGFAVVEESHIGKQEKHHKPHLTNTDIAAQAFIFFFAGFDTASTAMCHLSYELAVNSDCQNKLQQEIDEVLQENGGDVTYENILGMKYLDMVLTESLRKWPPVMVTHRSAVQQFNIPTARDGESSATIEAGTVVWIPVFAIHRDPQYYPNPDQFDPERFNDENKHKIKPFTYLPFGTGPRNCIGSRFALLEVKTLIFHILSKFEIIPVKKTVIPMTMSTKNPAPLPSEGVWLGLKPRS